MKAIQLSGEHMGKQVSVQTDEVAVAGTLLRVVHNQGLDNVDLRFRGGLNISVKRDAEVEVLD